MDARTGEVIYAQNADTRLHPASLTKMMTLYIAFQAIQRGEITLDTDVTVSRNAASEPPSKLGLKVGQKIKLRYLLRAAAVKSANDAATAIGEAIGGSEEAFATRMNRTAAAMGMTNTTFKNANGLTTEGHLSTARDMSVLGRHVIYDFPQYYNLFSRRTADAGVAQVRHTNRRFLDSYPGADGIKTGFTNAAGFNLVASAQRGQERIIATVFGGTSTAQRNGKIKELMDMGFAKAPANAPLNRPEPPAAAPAPAPAAAALMASNAGPATAGGAGKTVRVTGRVTRSLRPALRPTQAAPSVDVAVNLDVDTDMINSILQEATQVASTVPAPAPAPAIAQPQAPEVVTRISTSGGRHWGVNVGRYNSRYEAEKVLLRVALNEMSTLDGAVRRVTQNTRGFDANFMGLTREGADLACRRLQARNQSCFMIGSEG
ncbi:D-alanyl-D-alanine carboxypeptidase family protein [Loktanella sp. M215]|uniref:D-alanyl-D-alanine carboxypeptidase family protein n=1 Tax=Loktanella sp. M215 TaxID=2675431 RepID=UPI001F3AC95F|nr:D-alanyl-D-alanine carboxypeptidase family protein [Loktanella sp. M215]MCF7701462.1 D-alanyl-D-alanine carboxypeptidase [Loktanella sp. M215]